MANLSWGIDDPTVVTEYEIHGSDEEGFTPSSSTLEATLDSSETSYTVQSNYDYYLIVAKRASGDDLISEPVSVTSGASGPVEVPELGSEEVEGGILLVASGSAPNHSSSDWVIEEDSDSSRKSVIVSIEDESNLTSFEVSYYTGDDNSANELLPGEYNARVRFGSDTAATGWSSAYPFSVMAMVDTPDILSYTVSDSANVMAETTKFSSMSQGDSLEEVEWEIYMSSSSSIPVKTETTSSVFWDAQLEPTGFLWESTSDRFSGNVVGSDLGSDGNLFVSQSERIVKVFNNNGEMEFFADIPNAGGVVVTIDDDGNVFAGFSGGVKKFSPRGEELWSVSTSVFIGYFSRNQKMTTDENGDLYITSEDSKLKKLNGSNGDVIWESEITYRSAAGATDLEYSPGAGLYAGFQSGGAGNPSGCIVRVSEDDGEEIWRRIPNSDLSLRMMTIHGDKIYTRNRVVYNKDGDSVGPLDISIPLSTGHANAENGFFVVSSSSSMVVYDLTEDDLSPPEVFSLSVSNGFGRSFADANGNVLSSTTSAGALRVTKSYILDYSSSLIRARHAGESGNRSQWSDLSPITQ